MISIKELKQKYYKKIDLFDLELIISRVIKKPREFILAHPEHFLIKNYELRIKNYAKRRITGMPLAYIFGEKEFYGLNFKVNKNVLIPRPETELLVEEALYLANHNSQSATLIDVGTGSGCIITTLAKKLKSCKPQAASYKFIAIDISSSALRIARQNAKLHKVNKQIKFFQGNLLKPILKNKKLIIDNCKLIIVANLPYLTPSKIKNSPSIKHEPKLALNAGKDGLKYYRQLFKQINLLVTGYWLPVTLIIEIDPSQTLKIKKIIKKNLPGAEIKIKKDLRGQNRVIMIQINKL